ncbi:MAG: Fic family protein [Dehalococcoidales bacterium]|nr:Fic family protein [Dehalococcoidales bacterium]
MPKWDVTFRTTVEIENKEIISILAKCHAMAFVINNIPITPNRREKIDKMNILRAVRGTTGIEGADLSEDEVRRVLETPKNQYVLPINKQQEEKEARSAKMLMRYVARVIKGTPNCILSENLIKTFHRILTKDIEYERNIPGEYRTSPVRAGNYNAPPWDQVKDLIEGFIVWFNEGEPKEWDEIIRAIVAHFYIVSIHPFGDGNGRTARGVESFLLCQAGINAIGFYSLANFYYQHRSEYINNLDKVRFETGNDITPFILFALRGLASELENVHKEVLLEVQEIAFRDYVRDELIIELGSKPGDRMFDFMYILGADIVSIKDIRAGKHELGILYRGLTPKTLSRDLAELLKKQLIIIQDGKVKANLELMSQFMANYKLAKS